MSEPFLLALLVLATFRITWLITTDEFPPVRHPRERLVHRTDGTRWEWLGDLVSCAWCASGWVSLITVLVTDRLVEGGLPLPALWWFAVWAGAAIIAYLLTSVRKEA